MAAFTIPGAVYSTPLSSRLSITHSSLHLPPNTHLSISTPNPINSSSNTTHSHPHPPHSLQNSLKPSFSNPLNPILSHPISKTLIISSPIGLLIFFVGGNGGSNNGGNGGGSGGAVGGNGGDNSWWSRFLSPQALAQDDNDGGSENWDPHGLPDNVVVQLNKLSGFKKYKVSDILFFDKRSGTAVGTEDSFFEMVSLRPGRVYTKAQLQKEVERLDACGMFEKVDLEGKTNPDGSIKVSINFFERIWQAAENFRCINVGLMPKLKAEEMDPDVTVKEMVDYLIRQEKDYKRRIDEARPCLLPPSVYQDVRKILMDKGVVSARLLQQIRDSVQKWYHHQGYTYAKVVNFGNLNTKEFVCEVVEGDITQFFIQFKDKLGYVVEGNTKLPVLKRELPKQLRVGHVYNIEAGKKALRNITSLRLFSNIEVHTRHDEQNEGGIIVEIKLRELNQNSAEVTTEWNIVPGPHGRPKLASLQPGGTVSFQHRNIKGLNRSFLGSVSTDNFLNPKDDLSFNLEYVHPYYDGVYDPRNRTLKASCFNSCKLSPVFTSGPGLDEIPPIWVHRSGLKANIIENYTQQSKFTYGLVCEEITTMNDSTYITKAGQRISPNGEITDDGPPTTLSGNGVDRVVFAQANITRDDTKFVNGAIVGDRNVFLVDQGLGIGSKFPLFNRYQLTLTKFLQLKQVEEGAGKPPPPVLVLHGRHCGCVGDLPSYEAFALGGPYSVRGYKMGELGAARFILELAAELRIPVKNTHVYAFVEHGNDLGSSKDVKGNPTRVYRKVGKGSSYGAGVKLGLVRAEYAVDHNSGTGALFFRFGERF